MFFFHAFLQALFFTSLKFVNFNFFFLIQNVTQKLLSFWAFQNYMIRIPIFRSAEELLIGKNNNVKLFLSFFRNEKNSVQVSSLQQYSVYKMERGKKDHWSFHDNSEFFYPKKS